MVLHAVPVAQFVHPVPRVACTGDLPVEPIVYRARHAVLRLGLVWLSHLSQSYFEYALASSI